MGKIFFIQTLEMLNDVVKFYLVHLGNFLKGLYKKRDRILERGMTKNPVLAPSVLVRLTKLGNVFKSKFFTV